MKKIFKLLVLIMIIILPMEVKAESISLDLEREVYEHSINLDHNMSKIAICTEDIQLDDTLCLNFSSKIDDNHVNDERLLTFLELKYILMDNTLLYYSSNERTNYDNDEELYNKYIFEGEYIKILKIMSEFDHMNDNEFNKVEENVEGKTITKYYKDSILIGEELEKEYVKYYYDNGNIMMESQFIDSDVEGEKNIKAYYYNEYGEPIIYEMFNTTEFKMSGYFILGDLNVGTNAITINPYGNGGTVEIPKLININVNRSEAPAIIEDKKEDNNTIKEDENIKESPNTGSTINIVIGLFLLISFSVLLYLDKKHKQVK